MSAGDEKVTRRSGTDPSPGGTAQPVRTAVGAAGGALAGAALGAVAGPLGAIAGAVTGAVIGGESGYFAGLPAAPETERAYWAEPIQRARTIAPISRSRAWSRVTAMAGRPRRIPTSRSGLSKRPSRISASASRPSVNPAAPPGRTYARRRETPGCDSAEAADPPAEKVTICPSGGGVVPKTGRYGM